MAIYSTFFVAEPNRLLSGFPGWKEPLPEPVEREFKSSFTGKTTRILTREPEWPAQSTDAAPNKMIVTGVKGSYKDYLEERLSPFIRGQPHTCLKGLTQVELEPLLKAAGTDMELDQVLYGPPNSSGLLQLIPCEFVRRLSTSDEAGLESLAVRWAAAMSTPEHTHSASGVKISGGMSSDDARSILRPIAKLSRQAADLRPMYVFIEW